MATYTLKDMVDFDAAGCISQRLGGQDHGINPPFTWKYCMTIGAMTRAINNRGISGLSFIRVSFLSRHFYASLTPFLEKG
jgi:hypothetical protein